MAEVLELVVPNILMIWAAFLIVGFDERRMSKRLLDRAWMPASKIAALVLFSPLSLLVHFLKTRLNPIGFFLGILAMGSVIGIASVAELVLALAVGTAT